VELRHRLSAALAGRYEIEREIGRGGMSVVFLARDLKRDRNVALKALRPELTESVGADRFQREIQIASHLDHIHILPLFDSGTAEGALYYVMPYVSGGSLRERLRKEAQLGLDDVIAITREVADGISYANEQGIVHRDIKPENVMFVKGHAVVADFGIAHAYREAGGETLTERGVAIGTPAYMSPEQAAGDERIDHRSDLYSLACVVYEMLSGSPPFEGATTQAVLAKQMQERVPSLAIVRPGIPSGMVDVVEQALEKVPADRFDSATAFAEALAEGRHIHRPERRPAGRRRTLGLTVAALTLAAVIAVLILRPWVSTPLNTNRIVVFPLATSGISTLPLDVGHVVSELIGSTLEQTEPLKWLPGGSWLSDLERDDPRRVSPERAEEIARRQGARYHICGTVVERGDSADVILRLFDVEADSQVVQRSARGTAVLESVVMLGARAMTAVLPNLIEPGRTPDQDVIGDRSPPAVALWAQGDREYRRSRFLPALEFYRRAVEADSLLALAALKGALAANWNHRHTDAQELLAVAFAAEPHLPVKYVHFAHGLRHYFEGSPDSAVARFASALASDDAWPEAWAALGETYRHLLLRAEDPDSIAEHAFRHATALDPTFTPPLFHLVEYALWRGDIDEAEELANRFIEAAPDSSLALESHLLTRCARNGPSMIAWDGLAANDPFRVLVAAIAFSVRASHPECAVAAFRAVLASPASSPQEHWGATLGLQSLLMALHRYEEIPAVLEASPSGSYLYLIDVAAGAPFEHQAEAVASQWLSRLSAANPPTLWLLGVWATSRDSTSLVQAIAALAEEKAAASGLRRDRLIGAIMAAYAALARGDTSDAIVRFQALRPNGVIRDLQWQPWESLAAERLTLARLLVETDENDAAARVAALLDHPEPAVYVLYLPGSLELRRRIAAAGEAGEEERYLVGRLEALRGGR